MDKRHFQSQWGQDEMLDKLLYPTGKEKHTGIFIDIGACDGVEISNTYWLEKRRDWKGLLVEPIPQSAEACRHHRWNPVWQGCVHVRNGQTDFLHIQGYSEVLSNVPEIEHSRHKERVTREMRERNQKAETIQVPCRQLNTLMDEHNMPCADFMSIDAQTGELAVLQAYDSKKNPIKSILIDTNRCNDTELNQWFTDHGYKLHWKHATADEYLYINPDMPWTWNKSQ